MRKTSKRASQVWLLGLAGHGAKRIRQAIGEAAEVTRFDLRDIPSQTDFDRASPLAVFLDVPSWRALGEDMPGWLDRARKVLVLSEADDAPREDILAGGFSACLSHPWTKARITAVLKSSKEATGLYDDINRLLGEVQRERDQIIQENGRLAFFQHLLARAMSSMDLAVILSNLREDMGMAFPVSEVLGVFWGDSPESELFLPEIGDAQAKASRIDYLLDLAARLRGKASRSYRAYSLEAVSDGWSELGRALLVPLRHEGEPFGCLSVLIHRDLARHEQETAREAVSQLAPALKNALDYLRLKRRADRDGLTGLFNRRSFDARLDMELKRHMRHREGFALIMADLDHFKKVNDTHGHLAGDAALKHAAQVLESGLRSTDMLARYGGEEFAAILPHTPRSQAWMLAERLRRKLAGSELRYAGRVIPLTVSMGLANFTPGQATTPASLIALADQALYASKDAGRNRVSIGVGREDAREALREDTLLAG